MTNQNTPIEFKKAKLYLLKYLSREITTDDGFICLDKIKR